MHVMSRGRLSAMAVAGSVVAGALVGAGTVAWQAELPPFADGPCWEAVTERDVDELLGGWDTEAEAVRPERTPEGQRSLDGRCRIQSHDGDRPGRQIDIRVHRLDGPRGDTVVWSDEFLSSRLTPLGDDLVGMASDTRAWVALPSDCVRPGRFDGPGIVDVSMGDDEIGNTEDPEKRARHHKALARTAVHAANAAMAELGCSGSLPSPGEPVEAPDFQEARGDLCGIEGVRLPKEHAGSGARMRTGAEGSVRTCDIVSGYTEHPQFRLQTVREADLTGPLIAATLYAGPGIRNGDGSKAVGAYSPTLAAVHAECDGETVVLLARQREGTHGYTFIRQVLPAYVAAEAERLGCEPGEITIPD